MALTENALVWAYIGDGLTPPTPTYYAYYKFEDNLNDEYGQHNGTAYWTPSYTTGIVGKGLQTTSPNTCWIKTDIYTHNFFSSAFTFSFWVKFTSTPWSVVRLWGGQSESSGGSEQDCANIQYESWQGGLQFYSYNAQRTSWSWSPVADTWYNIIITGWGVANDLEAYINWQAATRIRSSYNYNVTSVNSIVVLWGNSSRWWWGTFQGIMDEWILDNKHWSAQDVSDYYNSVVS